MIDKLQSELEECIISSSIEDHHYCSVADKTVSDLDLVQSKTNSSPLSYSVVQSKRKRSNDKRKLLKKFSSTAALDASLETTTSDCFKRFYLQRQTDGKFVIVPFVNGNNSVKRQKSPTKTANILKSLPTTTTLPVVVLNQHNCKMQIDSFSPNLQNSRLNFAPSITESKGKMHEPVTSNSAAALFYLPNKMKVHSHHQPTLASSQSQLMLDHPKQSKTNASRNAISSPMPIVSSTSHREALINDDITTRQHLTNFSDCPSSKVSSLPSVDTIFNDRQMPLSSNVSNVCLSKFNKTITEQSFSTTIYNDHYIDFYSQGNYFSLHKVPYRSIQLIRLVHIFRKFC